MIEVSTAHECVLSLLDLHVEEIKFKHVPNQENKKDRLKFDFDTTIAKTDDNDVYSIKLVGNLHSENGSFEIFISLSSLFKASENNIELIERNAVAIIFPYLRTQISVLTCQPGMMPIVLPPININAYMDDKKLRENAELTENEK